MVTMSQEARLAARGAGPARVQSLRLTALGWVGALASASGLEALTLPQAEREAARAALGRLAWPTSEAASADAGQVETPLGRPLAAVFADLERYFAGERVSFDLPLAPSGSAFQRQVWAALRRIPYGETRSYLEIAREVGCPAGPRAVGQAVGANPLGIVVPCHRVITSDGRLGGFGGGLELKRRLLRLEGVRL